MRPARDPPVAAAPPLQHDMPPRVALTALLCLIWIIPGLVGHDPWKPDEAYTFGLVYQILQGGSWVVPTLAGGPFLGEPPLFYLSAAGSALLFSPPLPLHDAARLATGAYMVLTFLFCGLAGRELGGHRSGTIAVLLLLGCFGLVVRGHQLINDVASLAGFMMAYYGLALALRRPLAGGFWLGTGLGIVFMTQGFLETGIVALTAAALPLFTPWRNRRHLLSLAAALAAAAPWLVIWPTLLYLQSPGEFHHWLWVANLGRLFGGGPDAGLMYYLGILPWYAWPVWPVALWALWRARGGGFGKPAVLLPLTGFLATLGLLSIASDARELYALPLLLPLALLAAPAVETLRRGAANAWYWFSVMGFTFFVMVAWFYWSGLELGLPARLHQHLHHLQPGYTPGFRLLPLMLGIACTLAWLGVLALLKRSPERPAIVWAAGMTTVWALLAILFIGWIDAGKSYRSMIADMQRALPRHYRCMSSYEVGEPQRAMLHYFAGIITHRDESNGGRQACDLLLVQGIPGEEDAPRGRWRRIWEGNRPGDRAEHYRLYQRQR